jgi:hypothetical protein
MRLTARPAPRTAARRPATARLRLEPLEGRSLPSFGFGSAFGVGGTGDDRGNSIVLDAAGNVYVSGFFNNTVDFDPRDVNQTNAAAILTAAPNDGSYTGNGFVTKYAADGTFQWATDLGVGYGLELAVQGSSVYVPYVSEPSATASVGNVSRLDAATGAVSWTTTIAPTGHADAVAVSASGVLYADGFIGGSPNEAVVDRLDPATGAVLWSKTSSSTGSSYANATRLAVDGAGNAYATGLYSGTATFGGTSLTSYAGTYDAYVWKLNASGGTVWAGTMGGSGGTQPWGITTDGSGNAYVTGYWGGGFNNFNPGSGKAVSLPYHGGGWDAFIVKLTPGRNGAMQLGWAKDIGGSGSDIANAVAVDGAGNVYTAGGFTGTVNFNPNSGKAQSLSGGGVFVSKLDANGNYLDAAGLAGTADGTGAGIARGIALDAAGNVYTTGFYTGPADFDPTSGTYTLPFNGGYADIFVATLTQPGAQRAASRPAAVTPVVLPSAEAGSQPVPLAAERPAVAVPVAPPGHPSVVGDPPAWLAWAGPRKRPSALFADWLSDAAADDR